MTDQVTQFARMALDYIKYRDHDRFDLIKLGEHVLGKSAPVDGISCTVAAGHMWDGDGHCKKCGKYATDLIDAALRR